MRTFNLNAAIGAVLFISRSQAHFSLAQLQPIAGFSDKCTQAYEMPLAPCTISDFYKGATCSPQCVAFLEERTKLLNDECRGITAYPDTLIGMFFKGIAVEKLCPNVGDEAVSTAVAGQFSAPSLAGTTADPSATPSEVSIQVTSTTSVVQSTTTDSLAAASSLESSASSAITSTTLVSTSTTSLGPGLLGGTASPSRTSGEATASAASATSATQAGSTPASQQDDSGNNNGDGGTVLDAASSAASGSWHRGRLWSGGAGLVAAAWAMWC